MVIDNTGMTMFLTVPEETIGFVKKTAHVKQGGQSGNIENSSLIISTIILATNFAKRFEATVAFLIEEVSNFCIGSAFGLIKHFPL